MMMVLALGMSMPDSMIVVDSSTLKRCFWKSSITFSSSRSGICPWAMPMRLRHQLGQLALHAADALHVVVQEVQLATARQFALEGFAQRALSHWVMNVCTASRFGGGVAMIDRSRRPAMAMFKVRGIGVAVRVSRCTLARSAFSASFWRTPNRCSRRR